MTPRTFTAFVAMELLCGKRFEFPASEFATLDGMWHRSFTPGAAPEPYVGFDLMGCAVRFNGGAIDWIQYVTAEAQAKREAAARAEDERQRQDDGEGEERWR